MKLVNRLERHLAIAFNTHLSATFRFTISCQSADNILPRSRFILMSSSEKLSLFLKQSTSGRFALNNQSFSCSLRNQLSIFLRSKNCSSTSWDTVISTSCDVDAVVDLSLFASLDTISARYAHQSHFLIHTGPAHGFAAFPRKTDRVTLSSFPRILLSRHCTVAIRSGLSQQIV